MMAGRPVTGVPASLLPPLGRPPVTPDRDQAARWAVEELSRREYQEARPGLLSRAVGWVLDHLPDLPAGPGSRLVLVALLGAVAAGRRVRAGPGRDRPVRDPPGGRRAVRRGGPVGRRAPGGRRPRGCDRRLVDRRAGAFPGGGPRAGGACGAHPAAGPDRGRAGPRGRPALPALAGQLQAGAGLFDDVRYGGLPGSADGDGRLRALDEAVRQARTVAPAAGTGAGLGAGG